VRRGATEDIVAKLADYERSDLPERTKAALRLADRLSREHPVIDPAFYGELRSHFSEDEIVDLGNDRHVCERMAALHRGVWHRARPLEGG
jgi:alkylhydroperoxidase family enzyme